MSRKGTIKLVPCKEYSNHIEIGMRVVYDGKIYTVRNAQIKKRLRVSASNDPIVSKADCINIDFAQCKTLVLKPATVKGFEMLPFKFDTWEDVMNHVDEDVYIKTDYGHYLDQGACNGWGDGEIDVVTDFKPIVLKPKLFTTTQLVKQLEKQLK